VPAAAVIPALVAYIKVVAVKKLVVELWTWASGPPQGVYLLGPGLSSWLTLIPFTGCLGEPGLLL
jgi:hypothetical protein